MSKDLATRTANLNEALAENRKLQEKIAQLEHGEDQLRATMQAALENVKERARAAQAGWEDATRLLQEMKDRRDQDQLAIKNAAEVHALLVSDREQTKRELAEERALKEGMIPRHHAAGILREVIVSQVNQDLTALLALSPGQEPELWRLHGRIAFGKDLAARAPGMFGCQPGPDPA